MKPVPSAISRRFHVRPFAKAAVLAMALAAPLTAGTLFEEDFESPDVSGCQQGVTPPDIWVRAANGLLPAPRRPSR